MGIVWVGISQNRKMKMNIEFEKSKDFGDKWYTYDIEVFSNLFTIVIYSFGTNEIKTYRICKVFL